MLPQKRKLLLTFLLSVYVVFGAILTYLFLFNVGIEIDGAINPQTGLLDIVVMNNSIHQIRDIRVTHQLDSGEGFDIGFIDVLLPSEQQTINFDFPEGVASVQIVASAPYHQTVVKTIGTTYQAPIELTYELTGPNLAFVGVPIEVKIKVCNKSSTAAEAVVEESHSAGIFEEAGSSQILHIFSNKCKEAKFLLTPKKAAESKIYFNINVHGSIKELEKEIEVRE